MSRTLSRLIFLAIVLGVGVGLLAPGVANGVKPAGTLFIGLLKVMIGPVVLTSIVSGLIAIPRLSELRKIGLWTCVYFLAASSIAILTGLLLVNGIEPGVGMMPPAAATLPALAVISVGDLVRQLLGSLVRNPLKAWVELDVLAICIQSLGIGFALNLLGSRADRLRHFFLKANTFVMRLLGFVMWVAPVGIFSLVAGMVARLDVTQFKGIGLFMATVIAGTLIHGLVTLPAVAAVFGGCAPWRFLIRAREAILVAFTTSSSSATMPVTLKIAEERFGLPRSVFGFVIPLGTTLNMDGTALYEAVAALFVAQMYGIELGWVSQLIVFVTAMLASIGAPGIPSAGMVTMAMVLQSVGLPIEAIGLLLPIDRFLDTFRTAVNVEGDLVGSLVVARRV